MTVAPAERSNGSPRTRGLEAVEGRPRAIAPVIDVLRRLDRASIRERLASQHATDPQVGIAIIHLTEIPTVTIEDREYHFHAGSFEKGAVAPHFHPNKGELPGQERVEGPDDEPYIVLKPIEMNTAPVEDGLIGPWETDHLDEGEVFVVEPNVVHSARNGEIAFACPRDHLETYDEVSEPNGNRVMTAVLDEGILRPLMANGVPDHYPTE
jgi:hypothetical protein